MLSRRTILRGSGLALLPLLHSLMPKRALADATSTLRFVGMYAPNGIVPALWRPTAFGTSFDLPLSLKPLESVRQHVSVISNLQLGDDNNMGSHDGGLKVFLTASRLSDATSIDQVIGLQSESKVHLRTLNLGLENNGYYWPPQIVDDGTGYYKAPNGEDRQDRCNSAQCVASMNKGAAQANIYHPQVAFEKLFGGGSAPSAPADGGIAPAVLKAAARRRRVVDAVKGHAASLKSALSQTDRQRVEEYLEGVRQIEVELDKMNNTSPGGGGASCDATTAVKGIPVDRDKYAKVMCDLIVRAFQCDATRAATYMLGQCTSPMPFSVSGVNYSHHGDASHHGGDAAKTNAKGTIDAWQVGVFSYLIQQLASKTDADGTPLIQRTALYYGSDVADSDLHDSMNMPVLLGGALGGALKPGRHIDGKHQRVGDMFVTILSAFGVTGKFGEFGKSAMADL